MMYDTHKDRIVAVLAKSFKYHLFPY
ncbi:protein of unknown function [Acidithiobacillus ferrivorans]|uniref:Uncharacterized protein n=1 Tax=Acidithiobacillus ferrivorans TaxID=160808 RepID=A0A060UVM6_9PROT|nr:hypothetical protein AFERRI_10204 [Acidithiobacillus ferrivorans]SMH65076.1 protein of unknown function [Acidithiobacillus ferrivorans]